MIKKEKEKLTRIEKEKKRIKKEREKNIIIKAAVKANLKKFKRFAC